MTTPEAPTSAIDPNDLGGVAEISATLGVPTTNVTTWMSRRTQNGCPEPITQLQMGGVYLLSQWRNWHEGFTGRRRGKSKNSVPANA
jgi:hypothetical protein